MFGSISLRGLLAVVFAGLLGNRVAATEAALTHIVEQPPVRVVQVAPGTYLFDFGNVTFGNLRVKLPGSSSATAGQLTVRFGESLRDGRIDTHPPGAVRYSEVKVSVAPGTSAVVAPPPDRRNTKFPAVLTPVEYGVLTPFRWVEILGWPGELAPGQVVRRAVFDRTWSDNAASFHSSDKMLDRIWDLSHDTIKATTFAGVFVDGDRERLAYEADAYLDQLGYYAGDANGTMPRATFDRLVKSPTWPTEWAPHMVFIAHADWMETGDLVWLRDHYGVLKSKLLNERVGPDDLVTSSPDQQRHADIVDWPVAERDGYVFTSVNTVVNAFRLRALSEMSDLAAALGKQEEAAQYSAQQRAALASFQRVLFNPATHLYRDGAGTEHSSAHANLFPLAFGLVPIGDRAFVAQWLVRRGMVVSVYAAQYLMEALFENGEAEAAVALMTANGDRSWKHMVDSGTTITWEAWDQRYKPNQDWTHAWGAAPANLLPRFVLGLQPRTPGWGNALVQPHLSGLQHAEGTLPTPRGAIAIRWAAGKRLRVELALPAGMKANVKLPALPDSRQILIESRPVKAHREGSWWVLDEEVTGTLVVKER